MNDLQINRTDLYKELGMSQSIPEKNFHEWYKTYSKDLRKIQKTKNAIKISIIFLSILLFVLSFFIDSSELGPQIFQFISFILMVGIWILTKHERINPEKKLLIMKILFKSVRNS